MDIDYRGANSIVIKSKSGTIISDPTENVGKIKELMNSDAITIATQEDFVPKEANFIIDMPGEYEKNNISIKGIAAQRHGDAEGKNSTMYRLVVDGVRVALIGHIKAPLSDEDLENLGVIDVVIIPVGGGGYTLDAREAVSVVRQIDPKAIIPVHYNEDGIKYDIEQGSIEAFAKELTSVAHEKIDSLKIKNAQLPQIMTIYELKKK